MASAPRIPRPRRPAGPSGARLRPGRFARPGSASGPRRRRVPLGPWLLLPIAALLVLAAVLGVGRSPVRPVTTTRPLPPTGGFVKQNVGLGTLLRLPDRPWSRNVDSAGEGPLRATVTSGPAVLSVWIYARGRRGPDESAELREATDRLERASRLRDPTFRVKAVAATRYDGLPAIELRGTGTILGRARAIRSVHVFVGGREIVVDAYAPKDDFRRVDRLVFRPVLRSLHVAPDWRRVRKQDDVPGAA